MRRIRRKRAARALTLRGLDLNAFTPNAFTLVELLVVIGIIALLISILLPVLGKARESAISAQCLSNLRQMGVADQMYVNQYNWHMPAWWKHYPPSPSDPANYDHAYSAYNAYWAGLPEFRRALQMPLLDPSWAYSCYVTKKWYCPNAVRAFTPATPDSNDHTNQSYFPMHYSYGMNVQGVDISENAANADVLDPRAKQASNSLPDSKRFHGFKPSQVRRPADKIHFADAMYFVINVYGVGPNTGIYPGWHRQQSNYDKTGEVTFNDVNGINTQRTTAWRHKGGANAIFFDGHGEWLRKDRLYNIENGQILRNDRMWKVMD